MAATGLLAGWLAVAAFWDRLPSRVPVHFDLLGRPDGWGGRGAALLGPLVATLLCALLYLLARVLERLHDPVPRHPGNDAAQRRLTLGLLRTERAALSWMVASLTLQQCLVATGRWASLNPAALWIGVALLLVSPIYYAVAARRAR